MLVPAEILISKRTLDRIKIESEKENNQGIKDLSFRARFRQLPLLYRGAKIANKKIPAGWKGNKKTVFYHKNPWVCLWLRLIHANSINDKTCLLIQKCIIHAFFFIKYPPFCIQLTHFCFSHSDPARLF